MTMLRVCSFCHKRYDVDGEEHLCDEKLKFQRAQEKKHREKSKLAGKAINSTRWHAFRKKIIIRDGGYCQRCYAQNKIYTTESLEVHHIKPRIFFPELTFDESNCITLCKSCNIELGLDGIDFERPEMKPLNEPSL